MPHKISRVDTASRLDARTSTRSQTQLVIQQQTAPANPIALIEQSREILKQAKDITDTRRVMAMAALGGDIARQQARLTEDTEAARQAGMAAIEADALRLEAEASAGNMLRLMRESGERAKGGEQLRAPESLPATLDDLGVSKDESARWQRVALVPMEQRQAYIASVRETRGDVSRAALLRYARPVATRPVKSVFHGGPVPGDKLSAVASELRQALVGPSSALAYKAAITRALAICDG